MSDYLSEDAYHNTRQAYNDAELEVSGRYDTWILTLSGGALAISITFIEKIAKTPTADSLIWLKISWASLVVSLLFALVSLVTSQSAIRENRKELDNAYLENRSPRLSFPKWFTWITESLNWFSLLSFILGVVFLCVFSFSNIDHSVSNRGTKNEQKSTRSKIQETSTGKNRGKKHSTEVIVNPKK